MRVILPVIFETDKVNLIPQPLAGLPVRNVIFYRIDAVSPFEDENDGDKLYSEIHTGGLVMLCAMKPEAVDREIMLALTIMN